MSEEVDKLEQALKAKDENTLIEITLSHKNAERVKLREEYKTKFNRELLEDFEKYLKSDFLKVMKAVYRSPAEYDAELFYLAMKGIGSDKSMITELLCFRSPERIEEIKQKFKEMYKKDLVEEVMDETSGEYKKIAEILLKGQRGKNKEPDLETCKKIAEEIYAAGEGKVGTNDAVFIKYFTELSPEELLLVCKEYEKNHKKHMLDTIEGEFSSHVKDLLKIILYGLFSPAEYFAKQIYDSIAGVGTSDDKLIRCVVSRSEIDIGRIKKYYQKIFNKDMITDIKGDISGSYSTLMEGLMKD
jgi:hypothetical protein